MSAAISGENILEGAAIGAAAGWVGWNTGAWVFDLAGGKGLTAVLAGGIAGGAAGGATSGGLSAVTYGGNVGESMLRGAGYGALAGGITGGLGYYGIPNALASGLGGYASGYLECGPACATSGGLYAFGGAMMQNALRITGVGTDGVVPEEGSPEWQEMHEGSSTYATTPVWDSDHIWGSIESYAVALTGNGYSHVWHAHDTASVVNGYVPEGHYYKLIKTNVPYPANAESYNNETNYRLFSNNCTTRFGHLSPAQYYMNYHYAGQGAFYLHQRWR